MESKKMEIEESEKQKQIDELDKKFKENYEKTKNQNKIKEAKKYKTSKKYENTKFNRARNGR